MPDKFIAERIRSRREQMSVGREELGNIIDIPVEDIEAIEEARREPSNDELSAICSYLGITQEYLDGRQTLNQIAEMDKRDAAQMLKVLDKAFRALPHHTLRVVVFAEMRSVINYREWVSVFDGTEQLEQRYA